MAVEFTSFAGLPAKESGRWLQFYYVKHLAGGDYFAIL